MRTTSIIVVLFCATAAVIYFLQKPVTMQHSQPAFPDDENGDVLRRMQASGDNLDIARDMNFSFAFATQIEADRFAAAVTALDYPAKASPYQERRMCQVEVTHYMTPTHAAVTHLETRLAKLAGEYGGEADGWGSFQQ